MSKQELLPFIKTIERFSKNKMRWDSGGGGGGGGGGSGFCAKLARL